MCCGEKINHEIQEYGLGDVNHVNPNVKSKLEDLKSNLLKDDSGAEIGAHTEAFEG